MTPSKRLLRINDELIQLRTFLDDEHATETSFRLVRLWTTRPHILLKAGKNRLH